MPTLYFLTLAIALFLDAGFRHISEGMEVYIIIQSFLWFLGPPLSFLLIIQIAQITRVPDPRHYWVLTLLPVGFIAATGAATAQEGCTSIGDCEYLRDFLIIAGLFIGLVNRLGNCNIFPCQHWCSCEHTLQ